MTSVTDQVVEYADEVRRGARRLDRDNRYWRKRVRPSSLDMRDNRNCVLAQAYGDYSLGLDLVGPFWWRLMPQQAYWLDRRRAKWSQKHGFDIRYGSSQDWWALNLAWGEELGNGD